MLPFEVRSRNTNMKPPASRARFIALFQVGGVFSRVSRAVSRAAFLRSSGVGGRPVRPRAEIVPAPVPRCLVRRLRLVAMVLISLRGARVASQRLLDRRHPPQGHLRRE